MIENLKKNIKNKHWWIAIISALILLCQSKGFNLQHYIGVDWQDTLNTIFSILVLLGISVDTTSTSANNNAIADATVQTVDATNTQEEIKTESSTTAVNNTVTQNSASSKIIVDNPENIQAIGVVVNPTGASAPQK